MTQKRVVVTGLGALTPIGNSHGEFFANLLGGKSGAGPITRFDTTHFKTKFACEIKGFDPLAYFDVKEVRKTDIYAQYAMAAVQEAMTVSGIDLQAVDRDRCGVIWASGCGGFSTFEEQVGEFTRSGGIPRFSPFFIMKMIADSASGLIAIRYGLRGINYCTVSACSSSTTALVDAFNYIRWGKADMMIAGGSEAPVTPASVGGFNAMKALSTNNEHPEQASRPFDTMRDGFVIGEGAGALVLEEYEHARRRGAKIFAEVAGGALTADAYHMTAPHPEGYGAYLSMKGAIEDGALAPEDIDYINVHATSTPIGDVTEIHAIAELFAQPERLHISATKSMTGHLLGGAGAVEAIASVMAVERDSIPPTINTTEVDPGIPAGFNLTLGTAVQATVRCALSNTFGFGGHNASIVFRKYEE